MVAYSGKERRSGGDIFCPAHGRVSEMVEEVAALKEAIAGVRKDATETTKIIDDLRNNFVLLFVSKEAFSPVRAIAYGLVTLLCSAVVGALVAMVIRR